MFSCQPKSWQENRWVRPSASGFVLNTAQRVCADLQYCWCPLYFSKTQWSICAACSICDFSNMLSVFQSVAQIPKRSRDLLELMPSRACLSVPACSLCATARDFYIVLLNFSFCDVSHLLTFRIIALFVHVRYVAHGRSLIICPQVCRLSYSTSLIAGTTFLVVITAFADFLWATDWTEEGEKKPNQNLSLLRCSAWKCTSNQQNNNLDTPFSALVFFFFCSTYFSHPHIRYQLPTAGEDQLSCLIFLFQK